MIRSIKKTVSVLFILFYFYAPVMGAEEIEPKRVGKEPAVIKSGQDRQLQPCIEKCRRKSQSAAVGIERIMKNCREMCMYDRATALCGSNDFDEKAKGIDMLASCRDPRSVPALVEMLEHDLTARTGSWAWLIAALGTQGDKRGVPILVRLVNRLDDDWLGREAAARALGDIRDTSAVPALVNAAMRADTRDDAVAALAKMPDERAVPVFLSALQPEESEETKNRALAGLVGLGPAAVPKVADELKFYFKESPQTKRRLMLASVLVQIDSPLAVNALKPFEDDPDPGVREYVRNNIKGL